MKIFYSNRVEVLLESFKKEAFQNSTPFTYRHIITPTLPIEEWMKIQLALDPEAGIGAGLHFSFLNPALQMLQEIFIPQAVKFPSLLDIKFAIEAKISEMVNEFETLSPSVKNCWQPLYQYLNGKEWLSPQKLSKRLLPLSERLAALFIRYCTYGERMVAHWKKESRSHWQIELWESLFGEGNRFGWVPFFKILAELKEGLVRPSNSIARESQIHLFAFSHLSKVHFDFLKELSVVLPVSIYHLSSCLAFWGDVSSDRENRWLLKKLHTKEIDEAIKEDFFGYLHNRHRFLANTGTVGKKQFQLYEESGIEIFENYLAPFQLDYHPLYKEMSYPDLFEPVIPPPREWLPYFQLDLLLLKNPEKDEIVTFTNDESIEVHSFSSRYQEMLNLYQRIAHKIEQSGGALTPKDFLVMAPDITLYTPYIKAVFGEKDSLISYHILDEKKPQNCYLEAFNLLIEIGKKRWAVTAVLKLFSNPLFKNLHKFTDDELKQIEYWIAHKGISWGFDLTGQKQEIEKKDPNKEPISDHVLGHCSWLEQLEELIQSLSHFPTINDQAPSITFTQSDLIGRFYLLISTIQRDIKSLNDGSLKTVSWWTGMVKRLVEFYFGLKNDSIAEFFKNLDEMDSSSKKAHLDTVTFTQFHFHFETLFSKENNRLYSKSLQSIVFCSLLPMRAIPAQWIFMIGMNHDQFPRNDDLTDLNLLQSIGPSDYLPSKKEFDRSLFLEAILSARKGISISFISKNLSLKQREPPSTLIEEFLSFINRSYFKKDPVQILTHPVFSYDPSYFNDHTPFINYSEGDYRLAELSLSFECAPSNSFFNRFDMEKYEPIAPPSGRLQLDIRDLLQCSKSPLKHYFQKKMGCYFKDSVKNNPDEERFSLTALEHYKLKKDQSKQFNNNSLKVFNLPKGLLIDVAKVRLNDDVVKFASLLNEQNVSSEELFSIELHPNIKIPEWTEDFKRLRLPALEIILNNETTVQIVGTIENCCKKGAVIESDWGMKAAYCEWPRFLILSLLKKHYSEISADLIFIKKKCYIKMALFDSESSLEQSLKSYLKYYFFVLENPSPLIPEWCDAFLQRDPEAIQKAVLSSLEDPSHQELLNSCLVDVENELQQMIEWAPLYQAVYAHSFNEWAAEG